VEGPGAALAEVERLQPALDAYQPFHSTRADLLARAGRPAESADAFRTALALTDNAAERDFLVRRLAEVAPGATSADGG